MTTRVSPDRSSPRDGRIFRRKLIESALPTDEISAAAAIEQSLWWGHPATLHRWWGRKPLALSRAILFASILDDPVSSHDSSRRPDSARDEREELLNLTTRLARSWSGSDRQYRRDERALHEAGLQIEDATGGQAPPMLDPFCGAGSIPLEAQLLGLEMVADDLNPVATLLTQALTDFTVRFAGRRHMAPTELDHYPLPDRAGPHLQGLRTDLGYYAEWLPVGDVVLRSSGVSFPTHCARAEKNQSSALLSPASVPITGARRSPAWLSVSES